MSETSFYLVRREFSRLNEQTGQNENVILIQIRNEPVYFNLSGEECISGWAGCSFGVDTCAHGEFDTMEEAVDFAKNTFGTLLESTYERDGETIVNFELAGEDSEDLEAEIKETIPAKLLEKSTGLTYGEMAALEEFEDFKDLLLRAEKAWFEKEAGR